ncbi:MAG: formate dehydrogenase, alpha subunit [Solidesulfovibrio magneticus str. Maddingley MBC34]|uniref:Formate dehydrogenase, alpha subunit n=1 Tax=Solidesulfovibrio magneticus str. Maddingley MBC34 TaxID=1206767 RepID=K6FQL1_9BACT|nr:MAG: formate dehydrogenase, alpha subunit [Solidesulfovibrio magneticus str. Maddingley MBC34]
MTNHWIDIANSDCIFIIGSNAAENHPISFKWALRAKDKGATIIHVDPRYTRTSQHADVFARLRSGSDIPFFGGLIRYILANNLYFKDYVVNYTNASFIVSDKYDFKDGLFSGYDAEKRAYDKSSWSFARDDAGQIKKDPTLRDPRCVFQILKAHYDRYDMKSVSSVTGTPTADLQKVYQTYAATGKPEKSGTMLYAMGQTQHTVGVQNIRAMSIIQLLLGNMGVAGGGINALRGEANVQGSTDQGLLFHILPGYIPTPNAAMPTLAEYNAKNTPATKEPQSANWWGNRPKYMTSFLKSMYPNQEADVSYDYLPKLEPGKDYSWLSLFDVMLGGAFKGFFAWGQNPAASTANANKTREAMTKLDWMVTVNMFETETGSFWKGPGMDPKKVKTEVFFLPCAVSFEKEGSISNSGRWMQWRYPAQAPRGDSKPDGDIIYELFEKIRGLYAKEGGAYPDPIKNLNWDVATNHAFDPHKVAKLINGYFLKEKTLKVGDADKTFKPGDPVPSFALLQTDGSTCSGNWIYSGSYTDKNNAARRDKTQTPMQAKIGLYPGWTWAWPVNRRVLYNRASVDPQGKPYQPEKAVIAWQDGKWVGDVPDGPWPPMADQKGGKSPFIMTTEGMGLIFGPGRNDGPLPEHYEPLECPVGDNPFSKQLHNPTALKFAGPTEVHASCDPRFPFVCSTYRVTEHWQTGVMTRNSPWLLEAEPQMFCEMSPELAKMRGIQNGEKVILESTRGSLWAKAIVTERIQPFTVLGQTIHQVGIPWHYGWTWPKQGGDSANILCPSVGDPNTGIPETKAFMVNVRKA